MLRFFRVPIIILNGLCKWFAVPLSATQAPVTGLTDILTPVNLLPNSDFSRMGGYATTQTFSSIPSASSVNISSDYNIYTDNGTISNVTATISDNSLTITFTMVEQFGTGNSVVYLRCNSKMKKRIYYSIGGTLLDITDPSGQASFFTRLEGSQSVMYVPDRDVKTAGDSYVRITKTESNSSPEFGLKIPIASGNEGLTYSFTIGDIFCYEGCFKNPVASRSLDTRPNKLFIPPNLDYCYNDTNPELRALINLNIPIQRNMVVIYGGSSNSVSTKNSKFDLVLSESSMAYAGATHIFVAYMWIVPGTQYVGNLFKKYLIKCFARHNGSVITHPSTSITELTDYAMSYEPTNTTYIRYNVTYTINHETTGTTNSYYNKYILHGEVQEHFPNASYVIIQPLVAFPDATLRDKYPSGYANSINYYNS